MFPTRHPSADLRPLTTAIFTIALACLAASSVPAVTIDMVTVGDAGNVADSSGYGAVAYEYRIGKYEVTIGQYTSFLNSVAADDPYGLYHSWHGSDQTSGGILRAGVPGEYTYAVTGPFGAAPPGADSPANRPITLVSWFDAARFANWLANGQPTGAPGPTTTENGAYALHGATSGMAPSANPVNPNTGETPLYRLPTENEWYKAAYYRGGSTNAGYWGYATQSDTAPGNALTDGLNIANYLANGVHSVTQSSEFSLTQNYLTNVGAFSANPSGYGTFDQSGNVWEWNDLSGASGSSRGRRGGDWSDSAFGPGSHVSYMESTSHEYMTGGFRLVAPVAVPEPSAYVLAIGGLGCAVWLARRHRKPVSSARGNRLGMSVRSPKPTSREAVRISGISRAVFVLPMLIGCITIPACSSREIDAEELFTGIWVGVWQSGNEIGDVELVVKGFTPGKTKLAAEIMFTNSVEFPDRARGKIGFGSEDLDFEIFGVDGWKLEGQLQLTESDVLEGAMQISQNGAGQGAVKMRLRRR